ncbi:aminotransferase class V-fold PLP-dependent enzyme [Natronosporangium hydrolyticum]|uniref:Aminotransferase class V-fold PLP-dependent enzyme n=1 Tax=Natronosporangium hydrolyticum TaxID=2811111 RepID=A0A895YDK2_9ACTN|nr:FAD-dependent oxidoreductase [Natronosporangium hydrolyticum]QSB15884.1 aminotransferase class V-fold PLP-dependent enzyme [Natronosporangium hydrolyticum]
MGSVVEQTAPPAGPDLLADLVVPAGLDPAAVRAATPGAGVARHFNAAGAALPSNATLETVIGHLRLEARVGGYEAAEAAALASGEVYQRAAVLLGADADDIALVESATVAWHRAIGALRFRAGDRILATASSYVSSALHLLELRRTRGITVEVLPTDPTGAVDLDRFAAALRQPAALVTVAQVPTSSGLIEPVAQVGELAAAAEVPLLVDATQSVGQLPVDVRELGASILVTTGRKFLRGPRGTGLLYLSAGIREVARPLTPDVRGARWVGSEHFDLLPGARQYETWETSHALRLGLGAALGEALALGVEPISAYLCGLARRLRAGLREVPGVRVVDPPAAGGGIVTFICPDEEPAQTVRRLRDAGFHLVAVPASHGQWDLGRRGLPAVVRASVHVYNQPEEVDALVAELASPRPAPAARPAPAGATPAPAARSAARSVRGRAAPAVVVVGAGVHGRSAAWQLARRGARVIQLEQFSADHVEGSSHGRTRMIRRAYPNPVWDPLLDRAYRAWDELSAAAGHRLTTTFGGLYARPATAAGGLRGPGCELVDAGRAAQLFPGLALPEDMVAVYDPAAGVIDAAASMTALAELSAAAGVERRDGCQVLSWTPEGQRVRVVTSQEELLADRLVICAGPWTGTLIPEFAARCSVVRIVNIHVGASDPVRVAPPALGPFSVDVPGAGLVYGIPAHGPDAVKVGLDHGPVDDLTGPPGPVTEAERAALHEVVRRFLPGADGPVVGEVACRYTMAPKNRFAVGPLPAAPRVLVAAACSGHGFKFGPAIGAALADLVFGEARPDLDFLAPAAMGVTGEPEGRVSPGRRSGNDAHTSGPAARRR